MALMQREGAYRIPKSGDGGTEFLSLGTILVGSLCLGPYRCYEGRHSGSSWNGDWCVPDSRYLIWMRQASSALREAGPERDNGFGGRELA